MIWQMNDECVLASRLSIYITCLFNICLLICVALGSTTSKSCKERDININGNESTETVMAPNMVDSY